MRNKMVSLAAIAAVTGNQWLFKAFAELDGYEATSGAGKDPERDSAVIKAAQEKRDRKNQKRLKNV